VNKTIKGLRKVTIALVGFPLVVLGIILIPLPGPGLLVALAGLVILSTEFEWANKYTQIIRKKLGNIYSSAKAKAEKIEDRAKNDKD